jgi:hypothetical protein
MVKRGDRADGTISQPRNSQFQLSHKSPSQALAPLGIKMLMAFEGGQGLGAMRRWCRLTAPSEAPSSVHLALSSPDKSAIRAFHPAALRAGGKTMTPRARDFAPNYYAAFVIDPDGNNIEAVSRSA